MKSLKMSKGLEAITNIGKCYIASEGRHLISSDVYENDYEIIAKELEALDIIIKKHVNVSGLMTLIEYNPRICDVLEIYNSNIKDKYKLTYEEIELFKEVIENEI